MNVNDLALFRALDVMVRKSRRGQGNEFDKDKLVRDVMQAVRDYSPEALERMWDYKGDVMRAVVECEGGNDYPRHRRDM